MGKGVVLEALAALGPEVVAVEIEGLTGPFLVHAEDAEGGHGLGSRTTPEVSLLPILDPYLQGYRDRDRYLEPANASFVFDRGGNPTSVMLVNGRVAGVWDAVTKPRPEVRVFLFGPLPGAARTKVIRRATQAGAFILGGEVPVIEVGRMAPLTERGSWVGSPLRQSDRG